MTLPVQCIAFDADDTLWHNEIFYRNAENLFFSLFPDSCNRDTLSATFANVEKLNMDALGYGAKAMALSMVQTAASFCPDFPRENFLKIVDIAKYLLAVPTQMLPGVVDTVTELKKHFRVFIITKGELNEQQRKFVNSPLDQDIDYFVVHEKNIETYQKLFRRENIDVSSLLMVGNSPKSDVLPILQLGGWAAHIPFETTWALEHVDLPEHPRLLRPRQFSDLLNILL